MSGLKIIIDGGSPGSGKTEHEVQNIASFPSLYLFVTERVESVDDIAIRIKEHAIRARTNPKIIKVTGDTTPRGGSVRTEVEGMPKAFSEGHIVVICTHQAMMMCDFTEFTGWHIIIDEVPNVLDQQELLSMKDVTFFRAHYRLSPSESDGWSVVKLSKMGENLTGSQLASDDSHRHLRVFHRRVTEASSPSSEREVVCNLKKWKDMATLNTKWIWGSLFSVRQLEPFASITMLGNRFLDSLAAKLLAADCPEAEWIVRNTSARKFEPRGVRIVYFSDRRASKYLFDKPEGKANLEKIAKYLARNADPKMIWTTNDQPRKIIESIMPGRSLTPKQAGSNRYSCIHEAAIIYSAKPSPNTSTLIKHLKVSKDDWIASNEHETILQFVTRTSIRDDKSAAPVTFYVYEKAHAEYLASYFNDLPHTTPTLDYVNLGLHDGTFHRGRIAKTYTPAEIVAKADADREKRRVKQQIRRAKNKTEAT